MSDFDQKRELVIASSKVELFLAILFGGCEVKKNLFPYLDKIILQWVDIIKKNNSLDKYPHMEDFILFQCDLLTEVKLSEKEILELLKKEMESNGIEVTSKADIPINMEIRRRIFRLLRHPSRMRSLYYLLKTSVNNYEREINTNSPEFIEKELEKKLCGMPTFLNELLRLNNIQIYSETKFSEFTKCYLSDTNLKDSLVNLLEKNGIYTLKELSDIAKISLNTIPGIGVEKIQELKSVLENYKIKTESTKIHYIRNDGEKIHNVYHYCGVEYNDIISQIRYEIFGDNRTVFDMELSRNLISILCAKGYLYEEDVRKDKDNLLKLLEENFPNYYLEFETYCMPSIVLRTQ